MKGPECQVSRVNTGRPGPQLVHWQWAMSLDQLTCGPPRKGSDSSSPTLDQQSGEWLETARGPRVIFGSQSLSLKINIYQAGSARSLHLPASLPQFGVLQRKAQSWGHEARGVMGFRPGCSPGKIFPLEPQFPHLHNG